MSKKSTKLTDPKVDALIEALNHLLGNGCRLFRVAKCCSWNVTGKHSEAARRLFEGQAEEVWSAQHELAQHIRRLGGEAVPDDSDGIAVVRPQEINYLRESLRGLASHLRTGHQNALLSIEAAEDVAAEVEDLDASRTFRVRIEAHSRHLHELETLGDGSNSRLM